MKVDTDKFVPDVSQEAMIKALHEVELTNNGFHIGFEDRFILSILVNKLKDNQLFPIQIASGPLLSMRNNIVVSPGPELTELLKTGKIQLFLHLPFVINPYKPTKFNSYVDSYLKKLAGLYTIGKTSYVLHCSYPGKNEDPFNNFKNNLERWASLSDNRILIENLAGSASHLEADSTPMYLYEHFFKEDSEFKINTDNVGLCVDTEHCWASGVKYLDLHDFIEKHVDIIGLVHWNAAPMSANFGKHIDMHSYTSFKADLIRNHMWSSCADKAISSDNYLYDKFLHLIRDYDIPTVFERSHLSIQIADLPGYVLE